MNPIPYRTYTPMCMCMYPMTCAVYVRNTPGREGPCLEEQALSYTFICVHTPHRPGPGQRQRAPQRPTINVAMGCAPRGALLLLRTGRSCVMCAFA